jgi:hypothetical protein
VAVGYVLVSAVRFLCTNNHSTNASYTSNIMSQFEVYRETWFRPTASTIKTSRSPQPPETKVMLYLERTDCKDISEITASLGAEHH